MLKAYRYRLYPTPSQEEALQRAFGCARWAYNWALEKRSRHYAETGKALTTFALNKMMTAEKDARPWLREVSDWVVKEAIANCGAAYDNFFSGRARHPRYKSKRTARRSATYRRMRVEDSRVHLAKVGPVRFVRHRDFSGDVKRITVTQEPSGRYHVSFLVEDGAPEPPKPARPETFVGIDLGLRDFCALSNGEKVANPGHLGKSRDKLAREQRKLSRKEKGSRRYDRQRRRVARCHERIRNQRRDFLHKLSRRIVDENQVVAVEDVDVMSLLDRGSTGLPRTADRNIHRAQADASWAEFVSMLEYKCSWHGSELLRCGRFDPTTELCSACGHVEPPMAPSVRKWVCPVCGRAHDRDVNAAKNVLRLAVAGTANGRGGAVRRANAGKYFLVNAHACSFEASSPGL